jgi:hypothetical protein
LMSWKQWPAVITHSGAISEPEHALLLCVPSGLGTLVMTPLSY